MTTATVDPRVIAEALYIGTDDLARLLTKWAQSELPSLDFDKEWAPPPLDQFEDRVEAARRYLVAAHAAMDAWNEDNPPEDE